MTAEDPVEYNLMGINQVLVRTEIGLTFAAALKAFLRQDPNIIMVGEIRDLETGGIAIKAALTGHLVLSTLHTNDAPEHDHPSDRHGARAVQRGQRREPGGGAAAGAADLQGRAKSPHDSTRDEQSVDPWAQILRSCASHSVHEGQAAATPAAAPATRAGPGLYEVMALSPELRRHDPARRVRRPRCRSRRWRKACSRCAWTA